MEALIAKLEAATEGSRELDIEIAQMVSPEMERRHASYYIADTRVEIEPFSTSIDAALTLVPEGWFWNIDNNPMTGGFARLTNVPDVGETMKDLKSHGTTPALAICIAALKATKATNETH